MNKAEVILACILAAVRALLLGFGRPQRLAHAIYDSQLFFRTSGAGSLTATETSATLTIDGTPAIGLALVINVPKKSVGDTVQPILDHSTDNSTFTPLVALETVASVTEASTVPFQLVRRFHTRNKYVRLRWLVAGTSPDFGACTAMINDGSQWNILKVGQNAASNP